MMIRCTLYIFCILLVLVSADKHPGGGHWGVNHGGHWGETGGHWGDVRRGGHVDGNHGGGHGDGNHGGGHGDGHHGGGKPDCKNGVSMVRDYDFNGLGQSYWLKVWHDSENRLVCWNDFWVDYQTDDWCMDYDMTYGSPYTGRDEKGEVTLALNCDSAERPPGDCQVLEPKTANCSWHVRIQCMDPVSKFQKYWAWYTMWIVLTAMTGLLLLVSCVMLCCRRNRRNTTDPMAAGQPVVTAGEKPPLPDYPQPLAVTVLPDQPPAYPVASASPPKY